MSEASTHRWPAKALTGDIVRSVVAFGIVVALTMLVSIGSFGSIAMLALVLLFGLYLANTISRLTSVVEVDDEGVRLSGGLFGSRAIKWAELQRFELKHFPLSRDRKTGWMDLKLKGGDTITIDDRLDRFHDVLARAWEEARKAEVGISDTTHANLVAAGILAKPKR